jgi:hypothetical protein
VRYDAADFPIGSDPALTEVNLGPPMATGDLA